MPRVRHTRLAHTLQTLRRRFGEGVVMQLGGTTNLNVDVLSTGYSELDEALGVGGLPRGKIVEIYRPKNSGKTALCLKVIATCQTLRQSFLDKVAINREIVAEAARVLGGGQGAEGQGSRGAFTT